MWKDLMNMKLSIVDDNAALRRIIRYFVADLADDINEIDDGEDAAAAYGRFLPDWVLMDIQLNRLGGIAATAEIMAAFPAANIVIVTDHNNDTLREKAALAGARGYVLKE